MPILETHVAADAPTRERVNRALAAELRVRASRIALGGDARSRERHVARGKLLPRARVDALLDPGSPFLEIAQFAAEDVYDDVVPGAAFDRRIVADNHTPLFCDQANTCDETGTYYPLTVKKHLRAQEIALENALPCIYLVDSGGAFLPMQGEVFPDRDHFGRIFYNQAQMSARGIAQIAVMMDSSHIAGT